MEGRALLVVHAQRNRPEGRDGRVCIPNVICHHLFEGGAAGLPVHTQAAGESTHATHDVVVAILDVVEVVPVIDEPIGIDEVLLLGLERRHRRSDGKLSAIPLGPAIGQKESSR